MLPTDMMPITVAARSKAWVYGRSLDGIAGSNLLPTDMMPITVAARSKAWVYGRSLDGFAGSNPAEGHACLSVVTVVCRQVEVSASG